MQCDCFSTTGTGPQYYLDKVLPCVGHVNLSVLSRESAADHVHGVGPGKPSTRVLLLATRGLLMGSGQRARIAEQGRTRLGMTQNYEVGGRMGSFEEVSTGAQISRKKYFYSQAVRAGDFLFVSGQAAIDADGNVVGLGDFDAQAEQVFANLEAVLRAGGSDLSQVMKVTIFMTDMSFFHRIVELRERFFTPPYPADTTVEVRALALEGLMLEIEAIALVSA